MSLETYDKFSKINKIDLAIYKSEKEERNKKAN